MPAKNKRRKPTQERSRALVEAVLEATAQILVSEGPDKASTNRIARRAGVSVGSVYQYFPNKEALIEALAERHVQRRLEVALTHLQGAFDQSIEELTRRAVTALIAAHRESPELHQVLAQQASVDVVQRLRRVAEQALAADMTLRHQRGENSVTNPELAAFLVVTVIDESIQTAVQHRPDLLEDDALIEELTRLTVRYTAPTPTR